MRFAYYYLSRLRPMQKRDTSKPFFLLFARYSLFETYVNEIPQNLPQSRAVRICCLRPMQNEIPLFSINFCSQKELFLMLYPYAISRESVNGHRVWIAKSLHLKGCVAQGDTRLEAIKELESNEITWLETARMLHIPQSN